MALPYESYGLEELLWRTRGNFTLPIRTVH